RLNALRSHYPDLSDVLVIPSAGLPPDRRRGLRVVTSARAVVLPAGGGEARAEVADRSAGGPAPGLRRPAEGGAGPLGRAGRRGAAGSRCGRGGASAGCGPTAGGRRGAGYWEARRAPGTGPGRPRGAAGIMNAWSEGADGSWNSPWVPPPQRSLPTLAYLLSAG